MTKTRAQPQGLRSALRRAHLLLTSAHCFQKLAARVYFAGWVPDKAWTKATGVQRIYYQAASQFTEGGPPSSPLLPLNSLIQVVGGGHQVPIPIHLLQHSYRKRSSRSAPDLTKIPARLRLAEGEDRLDRLGGRLAIIPYGRGRSRPFWRAAPGSALGFVRVSAVGGIVGIQPSVAHRPQGWRCAAVNPRPP